MEAELKEILNDLDSLRQSLLDPSSIHMLQSRVEHLTKLAKSAPVGRTKVKKEYLLEKPARDAAIRAKMEAEALLVPEGPLHADNEWDISWEMRFFSVVDDSEPEKTDATSSDALPEGLTRELPTADEFQKPPAAEPATTTFDDIEELRKQLDALNAD